MSPDEQLGYADASDRAHSYADASDRAHGYADASDRAHGYADASDRAHGYADARAGYLKRLRRIEGQVRGLQRMIDEDQYCIDILTQISAVTHALESVALALLDDHLGHCVVRAAREGGEEAEAKLAEASAAIARLVRS